MFGRRECAGVGGISWCYRTQLIVIAGNLTSRRYIGTSCVAISSKSHRRNNV